MSGFMRIKQGDRLKSIAINRADVATGTVGRALLLDPQPQACYLAYDSQRKRMVFCDQEMAIKYKLSPRATYLYLIARLNTTMRGEVAGSDIVIEYLSLSDKVYEAFDDAVQEMDHVATLKLKKEASSPTFSYVKPIPSKEEVPEIFMKPIQEQLSKMNINQMWQMIQNNIAMSPEDYEKLVNETPSEEQTKRLNSAASGTADFQKLANIQRRQVAAPVTQQAPEIRDNSQFDEAEAIPPTDFSDGGDFDEQ